MEIQLNGELVYNTDLPFEEQNEEVKQYVNGIAFDYNGASPESIYEGTGEVGHPIRYSKIVHVIADKIKTIVFWNYESEYGAQDCFKGVFSLKVEIL